MLFKDFKFNKNEIQDFKLDANHKIEKQKKLKTQKDFASIMNNVKKSIFQGIQN